jgi:hypothetical protein
MNSRRALTAANFPSSVIDGQAARNEIMRTQINVTRSRGRFLTRTAELCRQPVSTSLLLSICISLSVSDLSLREPKFQVARMSTFDG